MITSYNKFEIEIVRIITKVFTFHFSAMYLLTYVGRMINGLTILILIWVSVFSAPRIYKDNQAKIDEAIAPIKIKIEELMSKFKGAKKEE